MSLSIGWSITAPWPDRHEVVNRVADLRRHAATRPFTVVDEVIVCDESLHGLLHSFRRAA